MLKFLLIVSFLANHQISDDDLSKKYRSMNKVDDPEIAAIYSEFKNLVQPRPWTSASGNYQFRGRLKQIIDNGVEVELSNFEKSVRVKTKELDKGGQEVIKRVLDLEKKLNARMETIASDVIESTEPNSENKKPNVEAGLIETNKKPPGQQPSVEERLEGTPDETNKKSMGGKSVSGDGTQSRDNVRPDTEKTKPEDIADIAKNPSNESVNIHEWNSEPPPLAIAPFDSTTAKKHQQLWADYLNVPVEYTNSIGMTFRLIPGGEYMMGSDDHKARRGLRGKQHRVRISRSFYLQATEVTQKQWKIVMGTEPWKGKDFVKEGDNYPATYVNWEGAEEFCRKLGERESDPYRLPTEAEWEYACRAGTETVYSFGDDTSQLSQYAWWLDNVNAESVEYGRKFGLENAKRAKYAREVGRKDENAWGLYDMHGNVCEWCCDLFGHDYYKSSPMTDPQGPANGSDRVLRGGSWTMSAEASQSWARGGVSPTDCNFSIGFRVARILSSQASESNK